MKKAIVTGGAGFIGSHIADGLLAEGYEVHVIDNLSGGKREQVPAGAVFHEIDVLDTLSVTEICKGADIVFHEAALPQVQFSIEQPMESHRVNVDGTLSMLVAARDAKVGRFVYAASAAAYGNQAELPFREEMPAAPVHPYGVHKYTGELNVKLFADVYGLSAVSLRYFNVYGPRMDPSGPYGIVIGRFLKQASEGTPLTITGDGTQTRDFVHVSDVVRANLAAGTHAGVGKGEVINIGTGKGITVNALADIIAEGDREMLPPRVEIRDAVADISKAKALLGWEPSVTLERGIGELKKAYGL